MWRIDWNDDAYLQLAPAWAGWSLAAQICVLAVSLLALIWTLIWLAKWDRRLTTPRRANALLGLRLAVATVAWCIATLQPTFVVEQERESPSRVLIAVDHSASMETADVQRSADEASKLARILGIDVKTTTGLERKEIVRRLLTTDDVNLIERFAAAHQVELIGFRDRAEACPLPLPAESFKEAAPTHVGTDLSAPLADALKRSDEASGRLIGIVLLSDGQHNAGSDLLVQARELARRRIPIFAAPIGSKIPPADVAVIEVKAPTQVAKDTETIVEAKLRIRGIPAGRIEVRLAAPGLAKDAKSEHIIEHDGKDETLSIPFPVKFEQFGSHRIEVAAKPLNEAKEISLDNNRLAAITRVASDKTRVLLIDSDVGWEHYYLATALTRDPDVAVERVVFQQPRVGTAPEAKLESQGYAKRSLPKREPNRDDPLWAFDLIVIGDAAPDDLSIADRRRLEAYVGERGGAILLQAGKRWLPRDYSADDPLTKLVPIESHVEVRPKEGFRLRLSDGGMQTPFLRLDDQDSENRKIWAELPKHYWAIGGKPKPGAVVLAEADGSSAKGAAVLIQANYGLGKVIYLGIDSTWRWRYRVGDKHHHRFWGQLVRSAGTDPWTPGANRIVRFGMTAPTYGRGEEPEAVVRIAEKIPLPPGPMRVKALRQIEGEKEQAAGTFVLPVDPKRPRLWQGRLKGLSPGNYRLEPDLPEFRENIAKEKGPDRRDLFTVQPPEDRETLDLATNYELLSAVAEASGGRLVPIEEVRRLPELLQRLVTKKHERYETRPWQDSPWTWQLFALMFGLLALEWAGRKWAGLP